MRTRRWVGVDIVFVPKIKKLIEDKVAISKIFSNEELKDATVEHLAGIFAAKEAFFKAIGEKKNWLSVEVRKEKSGGPYIINDSGFESELSISHDGDYAVAVVMLFEDSKE